MSLTDEERLELEAKIRDELSREHEERIASLNRRREDSKRRHRSREEAQRTAEVATLRQEIQQQFYEEQGYKKYVDSTGREVWLPPEEYEWRMRRRRRKVRQQGRELNLTPRFRTVAIYVGIALAAILFGLLLTGPLAR